MTKTNPISSRQSHGRSSQLGLGSIWVRSVLILALIRPVRAGEPLSIPVPGDDATYRTTLVVRKGAALGTGIIIASVEGESLILTAAHVIEDPGPLHVELFRYNLGWERDRSASGFPRRLAATVAAQNHDTDLAILRVVGQLELPYVARIAPLNRPIPSGTPVTSIGFDRGERLIGFPTRVKRVERIDLDRGGGGRSFLITDHPPEVGRSGGGLFLEDGQLAGVCLARAQLRPGATLGMYSTIANVRSLIDANERLAKVISRSHPVVGSKQPRPSTVQRPNPAQINRTGNRLRAN